MSFRKSILLAVLLSCAAAGTATAQENRTADLVKKTAGCAQVVETQGVERLVLHTGHKRTAGVANQKFYPDDIELLLDEHTWRVLEQQILGPFGRPVTLTDRWGNKVQIARASVYNENGLMFYMGTRNVTITEEDFFLLKGRNNNLTVKK